MVQWNVKSICYALTAFLLMGGSAVMAEGLFTNSGFDDGSTFTMDSADFADVDSSTLEGWRLVSVGTADGTFAVVEEATAPSAPQVLQINRRQWAAGDGFWVDRWSSPVPVESGNMYKLSACARAVTAEAGSLQLDVAGFTEEGASVAVAHLPTVINNEGGIWEKYEMFIIFPETVATGTALITPVDDGPTFQVDDMVLEDVTTGNRMFNGDFENSPTRLLGPWELINAGASNACELSSDSAHGDQAMRISQTTAELGDGFLIGPNIYWEGSNECYVSFSVKDDPTVTDDNDSLQFYMGTWGGTTYVDSWAATFVITVEGDGYKNYSYQFTPLEGTTSIRPLFRIQTGPNALINGDVIVDNIVIGDVTAGFVPPTIAVTGEAAILEGFGEVDQSLGVPSTKSLTVANGGTVPMIVDLAIEGLDAGDFSFQCAMGESFDLPAGEQTTVDVSFMPQVFSQGDEKEATLVLTHNDTERDDDLDTDGNQVVLELGGVSVPVELSAFTIE